MYLLTLRTGLHGSIQQVMKFTIKLKDKHIFQDGRTPSDRPSSKKHQIYITRSWKIAMWP